MKRLFVVKNDKGNVVNGDDSQPVYFEQKSEAKKYRDSLDGKHTVSTGPDHSGLHKRRGRTHTRARRTH